MRIAIVDDVAVCREEIQTYLQAFCDEHRVRAELVLSNFDSGAALLETLRAGRYDLIFLDCYMEGMDGLKTAEKIRQIDGGVPLVFITASRDYAVESYQVRASGYLLKPFTYADFVHMLDLIHIEKIFDSRFIEAAGKRVLLKDIVYCDVDAHYTQVHTAANGVLRLRMPFKRFAELLAPYGAFLPCYRGCIVNMARVKQLNELSFLTDTGSTVPFRKRDYPEIARQYADFLFEKARRDQE